MGYRSKRKAWSSRLIVLAMITMMLSLPFRAPQASANTDLGQILISPDTAKQEITDWGFDIKYGKDANYLADATNGAAYAHEIFGDDGMNVLRIPFFAYADTLNPDGTHAVDSSYYTTVITAMDTALKEKSTLKIFASLKLQNGNASFPTWMKNSDGTVIPDQYAVAMEDFLSFMDSQQYTDTNGVVHNVNVDLFGIDNEDYYNKGDITPSNYVTIETDVKSYCSTNNLKYPLIIGPENFSPQTGINWYTGDPTTALSVIDYAGTHYYSDKRTTTYAQSLSNFASDYQNKPLWDSEFHWTGNINGLNSEFEDAEYGLLSAFDHFDNGFQGMSWWDFRATGYDSTTKAQMETALVTSTLRAYPVTVDDQDGISMAPGMLNTRAFVQGRDLVLWVINDTTADLTGKEVQISGKKVSATYTYSQWSDPENESTGTGTISNSDNFTMNFPKQTVTYVRIPGVINSISSHMAAHYNLNEQSGTTAADSSGNGKDGTLSSAYAPTWVAAGADGGALLFDGAHNRAVDTPFVLDPGTTSDLSATVWVKMAVNPPGKTEVILQQLGNNGRSWLYVDSSGYLKTFIGGVTVTSSTTLNDTNWHQVGFVLQDRTLTLYIDGQSVGSGTEIPASETVGGMQIGAGKSGMDWNGSIDDVRIYKGALDSTDMAALAQEQQPKAMWKLDDTSGTTVSDSSSTGAYSGNLVSPAAFDSGGKYWGDVIYNGSGGYVDTPFVLDPSATSFTATAWVKVDATASGTRDILQQATNGKTWLYLDPTGNLRTYISGGAIVSNTTITDTNWHQVGLVAQKNGTRSQVTLYIDGKADVSSLVTPVADGTDHMYIGSGKGIQFWKGSIDDVRIYDSALTDSQMLDLYQGE